MRKIIILDIDTGSRQEIIAFEGDNTKELTTIALVKDNNRIDLTNKTIDMGYSDVNSQSVGDIIENINISNAKQGEITLPIDSKITKKDGFYNCAFKIVGEGGYKKVTAPFRLWIKANLFTNISKAIINTDTFNSIKEILSNADKLKQDLSNAETTLSNINNANLAAKENIKSLTDNNAKATELNKTLTSNVDSVDSKNNMLKDSLKKAEDFAKTLQGGTDFVQMRKDIDTLENNLKDTQSLAYSGSDITCNNSLEGRTNNMKLYGSTLQNVIKIPSINQYGITTVGSNITMTGNGGYPTLKYDTSLFKTNTKYTLFVDVKELNNIDNTAWCLFRIGQGDGKVNTIVPNPTSIGLYKVVFTTPAAISVADTFMRPNSNKFTVKLDNLMIIEGDLTNKDIDYFEGIQSASDKSKNLLKPINDYSTIRGYSLNNLLQNGVKYSITNNLGQLVKVSVGKDDTTFLAQDFNGKITFVYDSSKDYKLYVWKEYNRTTNTVTLYDNELLDCIQIETGEPTEFEHYYEGEKVKYLSHGKNLIDIEKILNKYSINYTLENEIYTFNTNMPLYSKGIFFPKDNSQYSISCKVKAGTVINFRLAFVYKDGTYNSTTYVTNTKDFIEIKATSTLGKQISYIRMDWSTDGTVFMKELQIEKGGTVTDFEDYQECLKEIQLQVGQEFNGLSNIQDTIKETNEGVVLTQNIGKRAYQTGDENLPNVMTDKVNTYYVLDKPIKTILKGIEETDIDTFNIITHIKSLNTIPAAIDFNVATNYGNLLMQHSQEINKIWDTINKLLVPALIDINKNVAMTTIKNNL